MQFFATALTLTVALVGSVSGMPSYSSSDSQCNTGPVQCCNSVQPASANHVQAILGALGIANEVGKDAQVGLTCTPIPVGSVGGSQSCDAHPVCCSGNSYGALNIQCVPFESII